MPPTAVLNAYRRHGHPHDCTDCGYPVRWHVFALRFRGPVLCPVDDDDQPLDVDSDEVRQALA